MTHRGCSRVVVAAERAAAPAAVAEASEPDSQEAATAPAWAVGDWRSREGTAGARMAAAEEKWPC